MGKGSSQILVKFDQTEAKSEEDRFRQNVVRGRSCERDEGIIFKFGPGFHACLLQLASAEVEGHD